MKMWKRWKAVLLAGMMACTAVAASVPAIGTLNAQAEEDTNNDDWLHAVGSRLYDKDGNEVWLTGANWFGMNCTENSPHGLYAADIKELCIAETIFRCVTLVNNWPLCCCQIKVWILSLCQCIYSLKCATCPSNCCTNLA